MHSYIVENHHKDESINHLLKRARVFIIPSMSPDHLDTLPATVHESALPHCLDDRVPGGPDLDTSFDGHVGKRC